MDDDLLLRFDLEISVRSKLLLQTFLLSPGDGRFFASSVDAIGSVVRIPSAKSALPPTLPCLRVPVPPRFQDVGEFLSSIQGLVGQVAKNEVRFVFEHIQIVHFF